MVEEKIEITVEEYFQYRIAPQDEVNKFITQIAINYRFNPQGYDMVHARVVSQRNKYYAVWERNATCD